MADFSDCAVCLTDCDDMIRLECGHGCCRDGWEAYVSSHVRDGRTTLACVGLECDRTLTDDETRGFISTDDVLEKYERFSELRRLELDPSVRWCPNNTCGKPVVGFTTPLDSPRTRAINFCVSATRSLGKFALAILWATLAAYFTHCLDPTMAATPRYHRILSFAVCFATSYFGVQRAFGACKIWETKEEVKISECTSCGTQRCFDCKQELHIGRPCQASLADKDFREWVGGDAKTMRAPCHGCRSIIELHDGCNHMTCVRCGYQFCMLCGEAIAGRVLHHYSKGGCTRYNGNMSTSWKQRCWDFGTAPFKFTKDQISQLSIPCVVACTALVLNTLRNYFTKNDTATIFCSPATLAVTSTALSTAILVSRRCGGGAGSGAGDASATHRLTDERKRELFAEPPPPAPRTVAALAAAAAAPVRAPSPASSAVSRARESLVVRATGMSVDDLHAAVYPLVPQLSSVGVFAMRRLLAWGDEGHVDSELTGITGCAWGIAEGCWRGFLVVWFAWMTVRLCIQPHVHRETNWNDALSPSLVRPFLDVHLIATVYTAAFSYTAPAGYYSRPFSVAMSLCMVLLGAMAMFAQVPPRFDAAAAAAAAAATEEEEEEEAEAVAEEAAAGGRGEEEDPHENAASLWHESLGEDEFEYFGGGTSSSLSHLLAKVAWQRFGVSFATFWAGYRRLVQYGTCAFVIIFLDATWSLRGVSYCVLCVLILVTPTSLQRIPYETALLGYAQRWQQGGKKGAAKKIAVILSLGLLVELAFCDASRDGRHITLLTKTLVLNIAPLSMLCIQQSLKRG